MYSIYLNSIKIPSTLFECASVLEGTSTRLALFVSVTLFYSLLSFFLSLPPSLSLLLHVCLTRLAGIVGARFGLDGIPAFMVAELESHEELARLGDAFGRYLQEE